MKFQSILRDLAWEWRSNRWDTGGQNDDIGAVRPTTLRRSNRRRRLTTSTHRVVRPEQLYRSDRRSSSGQTDAYTPVRSIYIKFERVTFNSDKSYGFWVLQPFTPSGWLNSCCWILHGRDREKAVCGYGTGKKDIWELRKK